MFIILVYSCILFYNFIWVLIYFILLCFFCVFYVVLGSRVSYEWFNKNVKIIWESNIFLLFESVFGEWYIWLGFG